MFETIRIETARGVATITLNRPEKGNAFNATMLDELGESLDALAQDASTRVMVLRAAGKHFCVGADLLGRSVAGRGLSFGAVLERLHRFAKPTVAFVQGGCVGGGLGFAACCDVLVADDNAFFSVPELRVGIPPSRMLVGLLTRAMGHRAFRRYGLSGERISPLEGLQIGLVHELVAPAEADAALTRLLDAFMHNAPQATAALKATIAEVATAAEAVLFAEQPTAERERTAEEIEGVAAFREKRKPAWYVAP